MAFWTLVVLGACDRLLLLRLSVDQASDDLAVIWHAAKDYSMGQFHEPFFYGQDYGVMLEAFLAAPWIMLGADPIAVVPIMVAFLAMAPFWSFAIWYHRQRELLPAFVFAAMPILLPPEHGIQYTNLNGLAILAIYPWVKGNGGSLIRSFFSGSVLMAAIAVNMNALVACSAFGIHFLMTHTRRPKELIAAALGAIPIALAWWAAIHFLETRPDPIVHTVFDWRSDFHPELWPEAFGQLHAHFAWLTPIIWYQDQYALLLLVALGALIAWRQQWSMAFALMGASIVIVISLAFPKTHDGTDSVFFPLSRMFLAIPLLISWSTAGVKPRQHALKWVLTVLFTAVIVAFTIRSNSAPAIVSNALKEQHGLPLRVKPIAWVRSNCMSLAKLASASGSDVVVLLRDPDPQYAQFMNMGCPVCEPTMPPTYMPGGERRGWRRKMESTASRRRILVVNGSLHRWAEATSTGMTFDRVLVGEHVVHIIEGTGEPVDSLLRRIGFAPTD